LRAIKPPAKEPMPSNPSNGSGDADCGSWFCAVCVLSALLLVAAFWSVALALWSVAFALWSVAELEAAELWPAFWSEFAALAELPLSGVLVEAAEELSVCAGCA
jgi:hypothetical protein